MLKRLSFFTVLLCAPAIVWASAEPPVQDVVAHARQVALSGREHRAEALAILEQRLKDRPTDSDARTLYGIILSWEGRYDESRAALEQVIAEYPNHGDATPALVRVEIWSDHPQHAEQLAADYLKANPKDVEMMLLLAHAQRNDKHYKDAVATLDQVLLIEPNNQEAKKMRRAIDIDGWKWEAEVTHSVDLLSRGWAPQHEDMWQVRGPTPVGSLIGRVSRSDRFGETSYQLESDFYPRIRPGTYMYVNVGVSPDANLYPEYRLGTDLYQGVGHGFELSGGYRRLQFSTGTNIYTWAVYKYRGDWLYSARMYLTPDDLGVSKTIQVGARRFFGSEGLHDYIEVKYSHGSSIALARTTLDLIGQNSTRVTVEFDKTVGHFAIDLKGGAGSEDLQIGGKLNRFSVEGSLYYRF